MIKVYIEYTPKRTFAAALDWHGWTRSGRDEGTALEALLASAPRYAAILQAQNIDFPLPVMPADFVVVERKAGNGTTEFGAPSVPPETDSLSLNETETARLLALLAACWAAFDAAVAGARGKELRKGPRGGGRELDAIVEHVIGGEQAYLSELAWKWARPKGAPLVEQLALTHMAAAVALAAAARGETPVHKQRGSAAWSPRFFARRAGWHVLDHVWEIEDRQSEIS